jgi:hypothetical protein
MFERVVDECAIEHLADIRSNFCTIAKTRGTFIYQLNANNKWWGRTHVWRSQRSPRTRTLAHALPDMRPKRVVSGLNGLIRDQRHVLVLTCKPDTVPTSYVRQHRRSTTGDPHQESKTLPLVAPTTASLFASGMLAYYTAFRKHCTSSMNHESSPDYSSTYHIVMMIQPDNYESTPSTIGKSWPSPSAICSGPRLR